MKTMKAKALVLVFLLSFGLLAAQTITKEERNRAIGLYDQAMTQTEEQVKGLSKEQLNFKPSPESWSIAECIEHMALSEDMFRDMLGKTLEAPVDPAKENEKKFSDKELYAVITNREQKVKTSEPLEPSNKWSSTRETMKAYLASRKETKKFIRKTEQDLRHHYFDLPFGTIDTYQMLIFGAGHQMRHNDQITEIKNHPDFPAS